MAIKMWTGKLRLAGGRVPGNEIDARITGDERKVTVEWNSGSDATGATRWSPVSPQHLDPVSLCFAVVDAIAKGGA